MFPASHVWSASIQILAPSTLPEIEGIFPEKAMAVSDGIFGLTAPTCTHHSPTVSSVRTMVPEEHPSMTTTFKHLKSHNTPPCTKVPSGVSATPSVQAIIVDCVPIVNPQFASIVRNNL